MNFQILNMSKIQLGILGVFAFFVILALLIFGGFIPVPGGNNNMTQGPQGTIRVWGVGLSGIDERNFQDSVGEGGAYDVEYVSIDGGPQEVELNLLRALNDGSAPDVMIFPSDFLYTLRQHLVVIPFESLSPARFLELYIDGADDILRSSRGYQGLPVAVDPIVLFYNTEVFLSEEILTPPETWIDLLSQAKALTIKDSSGKILRSGVALGTGTNITHLKEVLSAMFMQAGSSIVKNESGLYRVDLRAGDEKNVSAPASVLNYFVGFSNPLAAHYSWDIGFLPSVEEFVRGTTIMYLGRASDAAIISEKNPHLRFRSAVVPQLSTPTAPRVTYGRFYVAAAIKKPENSVGRSLQMLYAVATDNLFKVLRRGVPLAQVKRAVLASPQKGIFDEVARRSAIISRSWVDPQPQKSEEIFQRMVESVRLRASNAEAAVEAGARALEILLNNK